MTSPFEFLGPYRIGDVIGRGGMGTVYSAVHERSKEKVAVKLIAANVADEPRFRRRFNAEIKSLELLNHVGIVRIIGYGEEDGRLFYSMELVEGESLQTRIRREKRLEWRPTIDIAIQVCSALKHAHDMGVIHRDLKPANLLLTSDDVVKLVDFGIAKIFGDAHTLAGSVLGTADYMAPEQATSEGITPRTDLYALGSVMYSMLAGRAPFSGKRITQVIDSLQRDRPVPLDLVLPDLPEELVELIHELLEKDPADRPPTALAVMNRLKSMRAGLERAQTVIIDESITQVGPKPENDLDTSLTDDPGSLTNVANSSKSKSNEQQTRVRHPGDPDVNGDSFVVPNETTAETVGKSARTALPDGSVPDDNPKNKTHFQTVDDSHPQLGDPSARSGHTGNYVSQAAGIVLMVIILLGGAGLFVYAMRPPSADKLYEAAIEGDTGAMQTFLRDFPQDGRATTVRDRQVTARLRGVLRRFRTQQKLDVSPLDPAEESFLRAMEGRDDDPLAAVERMESWLAVYESSDDIEIHELAELTRHELGRLQERPKTAPLDPRLVSVMNSIDESLKGSDDIQTRKQLNGIIDTFRQTPWAAPAVERAQKQLERLAKPQADETLESNEIQARPEDN